MGTVPLSQAYNIICLHTDIYTGHIHLYALPGIYIYMQKIRSIYFYIPSRYIILYARYSVRLRDPFNQSRFDNFFILQPPHFMFSVPDAAFLSHCLSEFLLPIINFYADNGITGNTLFRRLPVGFLNNQFRCLEPFPCLFIVALPDTEQPVAVFFGKTFRAFLPRFQRQTCFHCM